MPEARPPSVAVQVPAAPAEPAPEVERTDPLAADVARAVRELRVAAGRSARAGARAPTRDGVRAKGPACAEAGPARAGPTPTSGADGRSEVASAPPPEGAE